MYVGKMHENEFPGARCEENFPKSKLLLCHIFHGFYSLIREKNKIKNKKQKKKT